MRITDMGRPVSISMLQKFEECPYRYYTRYILKEPEPVGEAARWGKFIHYVCTEAIFREARADQDAIQDVLIDIAAGNALFIQKEGFRKPESDIEEAKLLYDEFARRFAEISSMVVNAVTLTQQKIDDEVFLEKYFKLQLPETDVEIQGYIDLCSSSVVWDWKTGMNIKKYIKSPQLGIYAWALGQLLNTDPSKFKRSYMFLAADRVAFPDLMPVSKAVRWAINTVNQIDFAMDNMDNPFGIEGVFPKRQGTGCKWCGFQDRCLGLSTGYLIPEAVRTQEEAQTLGKQILELESLISKAVGVLKSYCQENSKVVAVNGEHFGMYPGSVKRDYKKNELLDLLIRENIELPSLINFDSRALNALMGKTPALEQAIKALVTEKNGTPTFKHQQTPPAAKMLERIAS